MKLFKSIKRAFSKWLYGSDAIHSLESELTLAYNTALMTEQCNNEDHSVAPNEEDVERYYGYHETYVSRANTLRTLSGAWATKELSIIERAEYDEGVGQEGWLYLRESAGLPMTSNAFEGQKPWDSNKPEWTVSDYTPMTTDEEETVSDSVALEESASE